MLKLTLSQEAELRQKLDHPQIPRDVNDAGPAHPNHGFQFEMMNLWCAGCMGECWHCHSTCCLIYEAKEELKNNRQAYVGTKAGKYLLRTGVSILRTFGVGRDPRTFIRCLDCDHFFCPRCISLCPAELCKSWRCIECHPAMEGPCDWHKDM